MYLDCADVHFFSFQASKNTMLQLCKFTLCVPWKLFCICFPLLSVTHTTASSSTLFLLLTTTTTCSLLQARRSTSLKIYLLLVCKLERWLWKVCSLVLCRGCRHNRDRVKILYQKINRNFLNHSCHLKNLLCAYWQMLVYLILSLYQGYSRCSVTPKCSKLSACVIPVIDWQSAQVHPGSLPVHVGMGSSPSPCDPAQNKFRLWMENV